MRHLILLILSILSIQLSHSQINELGIFVGSSNFIGDVGATNFISPNVDTPTLGILYKWNRSPRHSWRVSLIYSDLEANDSKSDDPRRVQRDYKFDSNLLEVSAGMEFSFLDFNLHSGKKVATPYLYTGISVAHHQNYYFFNSVQTDENNSSWAFGIPMALGYKTNFLGNFILGVEVGARYTFSDDLDGSKRKNPEDSEMLDTINNENSYERFGNINNNDWYVFSGITLTYTFGKNPCYCIN